jgi:hypothetical protein
MLDRIFTTHPRSIGEGYFAHQRVAFRFAATLILAGLAAAVHGLFPCLFETTGSRTVARLHERMARRNLPRQSVADAGLQQAM